jgi:hypothetical protein
MILIINYTYHDSCFRFPQHQFPHKSLTSRMRFYSSQSFFFKRKPRDGEALLHDDDLDNLSRTVLTHCPIISQENH